MPHAQTSLARRIKALQVCAAVLVLTCGPVRGVQITGYSAGANDRFSSGYPSLPVPNTSGSFLGLDYDWSGVGWSSDDATKGFGFLSPQHYLVARHYGGASTIRLFGGDGQLHSASQSSVTDTGYGIVFSGQTVGDISLGKLTAPVTQAWQIDRYAVLDLNTSSSSNSVYNTQPLLIYGRGPNGTQSPRIGAASVTSTTLSGANSYITTNRTTVQLEGGDSGSPVFIGWTNPNGGKELTILGNNAAINDTSNFLNYIGNSVLINQLNAMMNPDGFVLRVVGNPESTWQGGSGSVAQQTQLSRSGNWSGGQIPSDVFTLFDAAQTPYNAIVVNSATNLRGLAFKATAAAGDGFNFAGNSTLTIGRGGITNYDNSRQTITAPVTLGAPQFWDGGNGGITATNVNTGGRLLEVSGATIINGQISGAGGLALTSGSLVLSGNSTYTGKTWVHAGRLQVDGSISTSAAVALDPDGTLGGTGSVSTVSGSGSVEPGNSAGILTASSLDGSAGLDFRFEFTASGSPNFSSATSSGNDLLRLTGGTPFSQSLSSGNAVNIFLNIASLQVGTSLRGGFFTDSNSSFFNAIQSAAFIYLLANPTGQTSYNGINYDLYTGPLTFQVASVPITANFAGGTVNGQILEITVVPEPSSILFLVVALCAVPVVGVLRVRVFR